MLIIVIAAGVVHLGLWLPPIWRHRRFAAQMLVYVTIVVAGGLLANSGNWWRLVVLLPSLYTLINLAKVTEGRIQADYLYHTTRRSGQWLVVIQTILGAIVVSGGFLSVMIGVQLLGLMVIIASLTRSLSKTRLQRRELNVASRDLPSLSVCIPARNETVELQACLDSLVASDYPKLEILVLDDCSQDRRTPQIIKGFAHDGVRFIAGGIPPERWLAKNFAYQRLAQEATGEYLLFCGVDVTFSAASLQAIMRQLLAKQKTMLSILPQNQLPDRKSLGSLVVQPMRYAWELALPRRWLQRPPVLSTCWIISRDSLQAAGGMAAVNHSILPERYLARYTARTTDGYSFIRSDIELGLVSSKPYADQLDTAIRTRYPLLHRRPEWVLLHGLVEATIFIMPIPVAVWAIGTKHWTVLLSQLLILLLAGVWYAQLGVLTYGRRGWLGVIIAPITAGFDIWLLQCSMWQYEFGRVLWKDRDVRFPVMQVLPALPPLPSKRSR